MSLIDWNIKKIFKKSCQKRLTKSNDCTFNLFFLPEKSTDKPLLVDTLTISNYKTDFVLDIYWVRKNSLYILKNLFEYFGLTKNQLRDCEDIIKTILLYLDEYHISFLPVNLLLVFYYTILWYIGFEIPMKYIRIVVRYILYEESFSIKNGYISFQEIPINFYLLDDYQIENDPDGLLARVVFALTLLGNEYQARNDYRDLLSLFRTANICQTLSDVKDYYVMFTIRALLEDLS
jgi:hypothetical protein